MCRRVILRFRFAKHPRTNKQTGVPLSSAGTVAHDVAGSRPGLTNLAQLWLHGFNSPLNFLTQR